MNARDRVAVAICVACCLIIIAVLVVGRGRDLASDVPTSLHP